MADNIKDYQMSDAIWNFVYPYDGKERTNQEKQQEEEIRQKQSLELMHQYQQYYGMVEKNKYVLRESVLSCQYGTKYAKLDCEEDHGVYKYMKPVMAITDCANNNIHNFGSCLCPEANYVGRLPMTNEVDNMGVPAIKASQNKRAHICVPIISENSVWHQVDSNALIGVKQKGYAPMLLDNAVLVCQYGGIIRILDVPNIKDNKNFEGMILSKPDGWKLLKDLELKEYQLKDIGKRNSNGSLIGMMPYYVMKNGEIAGTFVDDGGITIGYGHHINVKEWENSAEPDHKFLSSYVPANVKITGIKAKKETLPQSGLIVVPQSTMVPIDIIESQYDVDVKLHSKAISDWLIEKNIKVNQKEFDALVIYRYNRGNMSQSAMQYLETGNKKKDDWKKIWTGGQNRIDKCQELFFGGNY